MVEAALEAAGASVYLLHEFSRACIVDDRHAWAGDLAGQAFQDNLVNCGKDAVRGLVATYLPAALLTMAWGSDQKPYAVPEEVLGEQVERETRARGWDAVKEHLEIAGSTSYVTRVFLGGVIDRWNAAGDDWPALKAEIQRLADAVPHYLHKLRVSLVMFDVGPLMIASRMIDPSKVRR